MQAIKIINIDLQKKHETFKTTKTVLIVKVPPGILYRLVHVRCNSCAQTESYNECSILPPWKEYSTRHTHVTMVRLFAIDGNDDHLEKCYMKLT